MSEFRLHATRIFAEDVALAAEFYKKVLGLFEVARIALPGAEEILLNFGKDAAEAASNRAPQIVLMTQPADARSDDRAHVVIHCHDVDAASGIFTAAGGTTTFGPAEFGEVRVCFVKDPFGNVIELLELLA